LLLLGTSFSAHSAQLIYQGAPTENVVTVVSLNEPNLLQIDGHKIKRIHGTEGMFLVTPDKETGVAWIKPMTDQLVSVYVTDDAGQHWKISLKGENIPAQTVIVKGKPEAKTRRKQSGRDVARNQAAKRVTVALYGDDETGIDARVVNEVVPLWSEAMFIRVKVVDGPMFKGEKFELTNISNKPMFIDERELYRDGVVTVSVEKPELQPAEKTSVFIVSEGDQ